MSDMRDLLRQQATEHLAAGRTALWVPPSELLALLNEADALGPVGRTPNPATILALLDLLERLVEAVEAEWELPEERTLGYDDSQATVARRQLMAAVQQARAALAASQPTAGEEENLP